MKWIVKIFSGLVFVASFGAAMYLGYKLFKGADEESTYLFGDAMYDPADQQDLYQKEPTLEEEEVSPPAEIVDLEPQSPLVH